SRSRICTSNSPRPLASWKRSVAKVNKLGVERRTRILGQSARSIEVVLVVRVRVGGKRLVPERVSAVNLVPPIVNGVLRDDRGRCLVPEEALGQMRHVIDRVPVLLLAFLQPILAI